MKLSTVKQLLLVFWLIAGASTAAAQGSFHEDKRDGIAVRTSCIMPKALLSGFVPVQITLENQRKEAVRLELELGNLNTWDHRAIVTGTVGLEAGASTTLDWLAYAMPASHSFDRISLRIRANGQYLTRHTVLQLDSSSASKNMEPMLAVGDDPKAFALRFNGEAAFGGEPVRAEGVLAADLVADWRAYTALRMVAIDLNSKTPGAAEMEAILDWTATGGILLLVGRAEQAKRLMAANGDVLQPNKLISGGPDDQAPRSIYRHHFGRIVTSSATPDESALPMALLAESGWHSPNFLPSSKGPPSGTFPAQVLRSPLEIPGLRTAPVALLIVVLISFALIIGPWQLKRQQRKQLSPFRFLLLTPLLGFGFTAVILIGSLLDQGIHVREAVTSVTWLDQQSHKASTLAKRLTFSGSVFRNRLSYSGRSAAAPWPKGTPSGGNLEFIINMDRDGALEGHYLPVRMPTEQVVASIANARGRVEIENENGVLYAINGLDVELKDFYYLDAGNQWHEIADGNRIAASQRVKLAPTASIPDFQYPMLPEMESHLRADERHNKHLAHLPWTNAQKRSYVATMPASPFLEDGGIKRKVETQAHLLIGTLPTEDGP